MRQITTETLTDKETKGTKSIFAPFVFFVIFAALKSFYDQKNHSVGYLVHVAHSDNL